MGGPDFGPVAFLEGGDERELQKVAGQARFAPDLEVFMGAGIGGDQRELERVFVFVGNFSVTDAPISSLGLFQDFSVRSCCVRAPPESVAESVLNSCVDCAVP